MHVNNSETVNEDQLYKKFHDQLANLFYLWGAHRPVLAEGIYGTNWRNNPPPKKIFKSYTDDECRYLLENNREEIEDGYNKFREYLGAQTWYKLQARLDRRFEQFRTNPVAYFCMEFGLTDWLQIYAGGLGILAGDLLKQASDNGFPMIGIGLFYHQGYFHQEFNDQHMQQEHYVTQDIEDYPFEAAADTNGKAIEIELVIDGHPVWVRGWKLAVGRTFLLLLDTNYDKNEQWEDKMITAHLYGGDLDTRIRQEIVLGIAGKRMLSQMGITPSIFSMNEGHSAFVFLEVVKDIMEESGKDFWWAKEVAQKKLVFTNHTLVQAGNDSFDFPLMKRYLSPYVDEIKVEFERFFKLGQENLYAQGKFSMTIFALRNAGKSNAVSKLHGEAAKRLWPEHRLIPITNGVHMPTWVSLGIHRLLDEYVGHDWHDPRTEPDWEKMAEIPDSELWEVHTQSKRDLIDTINTELGTSLLPDALTLAWSRRFTAYKQPDIITYDMEELAEIVANQERPVQILMSGKTHPHDIAGKKVLQKMIEDFSDSRFKGRVVFIPGYNWRLARKMVSGADVWMNTPKRYEEACGTSGMKASANGILNLTTLDGWTDEVDWRNKGWVIPEEHSSKVFHNIIIDLITPAFYNVNDQGFSKEWVNRMKTTMFTVLRNYSSDRMLKDYIEKLYMPLMHSIKE